MAKAPKYPNMFKFVGDARAPFQQAEEYIAKNRNASILVERGLCKDYTIYHYVRNSELQEWQYRKIAEGLTEEEIKKLGVQIGS